ncbi:CHAT domain-containing tetratricopeptide repeat protein [Calothrix sp. NIES-3974]|uniref:CHAT domain-containing tetratricopeptide repeat protein n=1 Tax=Calothrix sp. NIES-3974 TaxID=2005462 RepID=UPI000B5DDD50|nr:tetratricopeptide repeat protein [Calothrix sp. NIES-3974]BAZ04239.1 TPR domain protein [Calothrix sp. NIES-3974]
MDSKLKMIHNQPNKEKLTHLFPHIIHYSIIASLSLFFSNQYVSARANITPLTIAQQPATNQSDVTRVEADKLTQEGLQLYQQGTAESLIAARQKWESALVLWQKLGDKKAQATILLGIGRVYSNLGEKSFSLKHYQQALNLYREIDDKGGEATVLNNMGTVYLNLGEIQKALSLFNQALTLRQDQRSEAITLHNIGQAYNDLGEPQKALTYYNRALLLFRAVADKGMEANTLNSIGAVYSYLGNQQTALQYLNQALPLRREVKDKSGEASTLSNIGKVYFDLGEKQRALDYFQQALSLGQLVGDREGQATSLGNIGSVYSDLGEKQKALDYHNQALSLRRIIGDRVGEANSLNNLGAVYSDLGEKQKAIEFYQQALSISRQVSDRYLEATTLNNIGFVYSGWGENEKALSLYSQALGIFRQIAHKSGEVSVLNGLGLVYSDLGENQKALEFYHQALSISRQIVNQDLQATTLNNIGLVYSNLGEKQKALSYYNQVLPIFRAISHKGGEANTLVNIGAVYLDLGEEQKALSYYNQALPVLRVVSDKAKEGNALNNIGLVYFQLGEKQKALSYFNQALPLHREVGDRDGEAIIYWNLANLERKQGNLQASLQHIETAIQIIEQLRDTYTNQDLKTRYFATVQNYYKFHIDLLMELNKKNPGKNYNVLALNTSERSRARILLELLAQSQVKLRKNTDPQLLAQEQELQLKRQAQEKILAELINQKKPSPETIKKTETEIQNIINQQKNLQAKIRAQNPERDQITNPQPLTLPQIQQQLDKDTVLLQYSLGKDRSFVWLITPTSMTSYELPKEAEISKIASDLHQNLGQSAASTDLAINAAQKLSQLILAPVQDKIAGKRLVIVADGILQQIPFAALHNPCRDVTCHVSTKMTTYQPLFLNHEIVNLPSASTIAIQRQKTTNRKPAPKKLAILADPVYSHDDERVTGKPAPLAPELELERSALKRSAQSLNRNGWRRLPYTGTEAQAILKLFPPTSSLPAFDFDANYNWATSKALNQYQIIHFATHGFVNPDQPELSGLVLSLVDKNGKQIPGYLRLADLFEQDYPAELIVLSACETGLGKNVSGEGLVGLTRGLMYAGAARVALSLWQVNDEGTSVLMQEFYKQMLEGNLTPPQALRAAQKKLWQESSQWRSPHYWAAFTLQGEWR